MNLCIKTDSVIILGTVHFYEMVGGGVGFGEASFGNCMTGPLQFSLPGATDTEFSTWFASHCVLDLLIVVPVKATKKALQQAQPAIIGSCHDLMQLTEV